ncbi:BA14K family protein [Alsobacter sp. SYSU M60028]|uniref:Lectin-like protein BA14k n=1 Tax=Alsobacter ponti TaxID=2962936 RepID=A0ABT1LBU6_9HYPH|nr:BA14K family protein [Alsobacter ponti]MCP8938970.1 BA14K family protein [Alsobacter ponti]
MINVPALARLIGGVAIVAPIVVAASYYLRQDGAAQPEKATPPSAAAPARAPQAVVVAPMPAKSPASTSVAPSATASLQKPEKPAPRAIPAPLAPSPGPVPAAASAYDQTPSVLPPARPSAKLEIVKPSRSAEAQPPLLTREAVDVASAGDDAPAVIDRGSARGSAGCQRYKSYDAATQTYRTFDGKVRECKTR